MLVYPDLNSGTISGVQSICYNTVPSVLSFSTPSSGGQGGILISGNLQQME